MKELYATIDLGSNSFHMLTAALEFNEIKILDSVSEKVMLADGLSKQTGISEQAKARGLECLERFAQRLESIPTENVRIVGTNTLRAASNSREYIKALEQTLNHIPIDIISGIEEARLIFLGVNHTWSSIRTDSKQLVIDIGGGSTEFIIGRTFSMRKAESLRMGCVAFRRYFIDDQITEAFFDKAERAAEVQLANILTDFKPKLWTNVVGSAGTFKAIEQLAIRQGLTEEGISFEALMELKNRFLDFDSMDAIELDGLKELRKKTIVPGVAIAVAIFKLLKIEHMQLSRGGLREGILYDLIGRRHSEDIRERSITALSKRYGQHVSRIKLNRTVVNTLLERSEFESTLSEESKRFLLWAASCSQIGLAISHSQYQNHSAYLIANSELHGFTIKERKILAEIVKNHRRKIKLSSFEHMGFERQATPSLIPVIFILRLCFIITQNGKKNQCKQLGLSIHPEQLIIRLTQSWINEHPLIYDSLFQEKKYWNANNVEFDIELLTDSS